MSKYDPIERTGGQALAAQLIEEGVTDIFGIPGIQLDWAVEAIREQPDHLRYVAARHEQAASYMADGYARATGKVGVCMVVPGPGVLNALSGLATAFACSAPVLFIAGQIPTKTIGAGLGMLHEIPDQSGILKSLTKWHAIAKRPEDVAGIVHQAFVELRSGRPRPVAIELPPDVLQGRGVSAVLPRAPEARLAADPAQIAEAADLLRGARFPVIYAGGGAVAADAGAALVALAERVQAPVLLSEGGRALADHRHPLVLGALGGRAIFPHADVALVVGSRFVDGHAAPMWAGENTKFIYVNAEPADMRAPRAPGLAIAADARAGAEALLAALGEGNAAPAVDRVALVRKWCDDRINAIDPQIRYVEAIRRGLNDDDVLVTELTQVGYFSNIAYPVHAPRTYVSPGYQGTLGYGFNTALGAAYGVEGRRVVSINGDGGFAWGLPELATVARDRPDISIVVFVDGHYGNVRRIQRREFGHEFAVKLTNPDFEHLAKAYGLDFETADSPETLEQALRRAADRGGPVLIAAPVGEMPSPWALIHPFVPSPVPVAPNPLGEP